MKKIIGIITALILTMSLICTASAATTMYAPDGRTANVHDNEVQAWKNAGWYDYPVATVYAPDGRAAVISKNAVESWKQVGWYDYPVATVYAPDGRTAVISKNAVESWKKVGWYDYPVVTVYAPDGRTAVIAKSALQAWKNVGWYESASAAANAPGVDLLPNMSAEQRRNINVFLSNFSEAFYGKHNYGSEEEALIAFAFHHAIINMDSAIFYKDLVMGISASNADYILNRFFGYTVPHQTPVNSIEWCFDNGNFVAQAASGGPEPDFSVATKMKRRSDGKYEVQFNVYFDPVGITNDIYSLSKYDIERWCDYIGYGTAILKEKVHNGKNSFELVSYDVNYHYRW